jgi:hypothetical protein
MAVGAAKVREPNRGVLLVRGHPSRVAALLPVDPPERHVLVVDEITEDDVCERWSEGWSNVCTRSVCESRHQVVGSVQRCSF